MARAIGLDIGARAIKLVELSGSTKSPKVQTLAVQQIPPPPPPDQMEDDYDHDDVIVESVNEAFKAAGVPKDDVCASFDSGATIFREITVPFFEEDQIKKIVKFEAENHLHSHSIDDVVVNWIKTGETRDGSRLTIFASPKADLARRVAILRRAGVEPASMDLDTSALYTALETAGAFVEHPNVVVVDVGAHTTGLILVADGKPRVMRSFLLGAGALESGVSSSLGVTSDEGRQKVLTAAAGNDDLMVPAADAEQPSTSLAQLEDDEIGAQMDSFVKKLHREAMRSLASVRTEEPPDRIILVGGGALLPDVSERLGAQFGLPVEPYNFADHIEIKGHTTTEFEGSAIGPAIGCGLRMMGRRGLGLELLQDEFAPKNTFDVIKGALCVAVTLAFLAMFAVTIVERQQLKAEKIKYNNWAWVAKQMFLRVEPNYLNRVENKDYNQAKKTGEAMQITARWLSGLPKDDTQIIQIRNRLRRRHQFLQTRLGLARDIPKLPSALETMVEVYKALSTTPREELGTWFQIEQMNITVRRMTMKVVLSDSTTQDQVARLLGKSEYLKDRAKNPRNIVGVGTVQRVAEGRVRVDFTLKFKDE